MEKGSNKIEQESNLLEKENCSMEKENHTVTVRTHRVGAFTSGFSMVGFGVLLLLHNVLDIMDYESILEFWPLILIGMGVELLVSTVFKNKIVYDKAAIVLLFFMAFFVMILAGADVCVEVIREYGLSGL